MHAAAAAAVALALGLAACGSDDSGDESATAYPVEITRAEFPTEQRLGQTSLLRLDVENAGDEALPAMTITFTVGGEEGRDSRLPFGFRDPQPGLAQPDRPVWVLSADYPKLAGSNEPGGAETSNWKTFEFGPLGPGETTATVWKLNAVKTGDFDLLYRIGAGPKGSAEARGGEVAGGSFAVNVTEVPPETVVTDSGEVVPAPKDPTKANR